MIDYELKCCIREQSLKITTTRKKSLGDFRENPDFDNLSQDEKVTKKTPEDHGA
jgi:hypothetical protein